MARRRKANKKATTATAATVAESRPPDADAPVLVAPISQTVPIAMPSPPLLDTGVVLAPTHKKFGKFRCLLGEAASSPSSSSDDQTPLMEDWGAGGVVAEEVIVVQDMDISQEDEVIIAQEEVTQDGEVSMDLPQIDTEAVLIESASEETEATSDKPIVLDIHRNDDIHPSFERLSLIPPVEGVEKIEVEEEESNKIEIIPELEQPSEPTQDSQGSIDAESSNSQPAIMEGTDSKESKGEGTDTDNSSSSNTHSGTSSNSSAPMTRRRSSRIRNLQETLASSRETTPSQAVCPSAVSTIITTDLSPLEEENSTPNPPSSPVPLLPPQAPPPSSKPVKVKSRWRRSSELEMSVTPTTSICGSPLPCPSPPSGPSSVQSSPQHTSSSSEMDTKPILPADEERLRSYDHLNENIYLTERERNKETKRMVCDCFLTKEEIAKGELGCGEDCLNRLLMIECGSRCPLGDRCSNKRFQRMEHSPLEIFRTEKKGFGLRVTADVEVGDFLTEYIGEVLDPKEFRRRAKEYAKDKNRHYYFMALKSDAIIDATLKGNHSRFINHSCDPNAETQKWTVNGELRIGFFATKNIATGEEITFDYQFQRYGKEAQRCFCESANCRGWIGEDPDKEEKEEKDEKPRSQSRKGSDRRDKRKDRSKQSSGKDIKDFLEDMDLEQEVEKLCSSGLKNQAHTLTLCRLMVRIEDRESRLRLLHLLRTAETACRRLFLDYHGLRLIWSWMIDTDNSLRSEIMETLSQLPIPNKTVLQDSKVLGVVERWALDIPVRSPDESSTSTGDSITPKSEPVPIPQKEGESILVDGTEEQKIKKEGEQREDEDECQEDSKLVVERRIEECEMARKLLDSWSGLKEVFRIPKKERIEQMKEHEREADRGYKEYLESNRKPRVDRYRSSGMGGNKRMRDVRDSPDIASRKAQRMEERSQRMEERYLARLNKYERRQLFELRVEKEDRARRELWEQQQQQQHQQMIQGGGHPYVLDANGIPCYWDPNTGTLHQLPHFPPGPMPNQNGLEPMQPNHHDPPLHPHPGMEMNFNPNQPHPFDPNRGEYPTNSHPMFDGNSHPQQWGQPMQMVPPGIPSNLAPAQQIPIPPIPIPPLPPKWKAAYDSKGQPYYYHLRLRIPQWEPPPFPPPQAPAVQETPTSSESSDDSDEDDEEEEDEEDEEEDTLSSDEETTQEKVEEEPEPEEEEESEECEDGAKAGQPSEPPEAVPGEPEEVEETMESDLIAKDTSVTTETPQPRKETRRREGLVTEIIISPRRVEDEPVISSSKKYKEVKEKLRRQKEKEAARKQRPSGSASSRSSAPSKSGSSKSGRDRRQHKKQSSDGMEGAIIDPDSDAGRKIKEQFRLKMAGVMVQCLNPYRKSDCKAGKICSTEDFKHLARKLTHFVMLKELKHCRNVKDLVCNDNVKHKARDFVKKYMAKFGVVYQREAEN